MSWVFKYVTPCLTISTGSDFQINHKRIANSWNTPCLSKAWLRKISFWKTAYKMHSPIGPLDSGSPKIRACITSAPAKSHLPGLDPEKFLLSSCTLTSHLPLLGEYILLTRPVQFGVLFNTLHDVLLRRARKKFSLPGITFLSGRN